MVTKRTKIKLPQRLKAATKAADQTKRVPADKKHAATHERTSRRQSGCHSRSGVSAGGEQDQSGLKSSRLFGMPFAQKKEDEMTVTPKDAYEFSETDPISSDRSSSKSHLKKSTGSSSKTSQKRKTTSASKSKRVTTTGKKPKVNALQTEEKKQTSTPVGSVSGKVVSKSQHQGNSLGKRKSPRGLPALLDISVTPILPVPPSLSPKRRRPNEYDPQNDSYIAPTVLPQTASLLTPGVSGKPNSQAACSNPCRPVQSPSVTPTSVLPASETQHLKRKQPVKTSKQAVIHEAKMKSDKNSSQIERDKIMKMPVSVREDPNKKVKNSLKKSGSTVSKASKANPPPAVSSCEKENAPDSQNLSHQPQQKTYMGVRRKNVWEPGSEEMYCLSMSHDSGISFGSDTSSTIASPDVGFLPGFMEDEPLIQTPQEDLSFSPPPSASTSSAAKDPESSLNRSSSKSYNKPSKSKREKGHQSTSRIDQWASLVNQDIDEAESFELVIEG